MLYENTAHSAIIVLSWASASSAACREVPASLPVFCLQLGPSGELEHYFPLSRAASVKPQRLGGQHVVQEPEPELEAWEEQHPLPAADMQGHAGAPWRVSAACEALVWYLQRFSEMCVAATSKVRGTGSVPAVVCISVLWVLGG